MNVLDGMALWWENGAAKVVVHDVGRKAGSFEGEDGRIVSKINGLHIKIVILTKRKCCAHLPCGCSQLPLPLLLHQVVDGWFGQRLVVLFAAADPTGAAAAACLPPPPWPSWSLPLTRCRSVDQRRTMPTAGCLRTDVLIQTAKNEFKRCVETLGNNWGSKPRLNQPHSCGLNRNSCRYTTSAELAVPSGPRLLRTALRASRPAHVQPRPLFPVPDGVDVSA
jgi:hypothetical protein